MIDLEMLDAETVGIEGMDIVKMIPGVLKGTGQALEGKKAPAAPEPPPPPPPKSEEIGLGWKIGGGAAVVVLLLALLRRR